MKLSNTDAKVLNLLRVMFKEVRKGEKKQSFPIFSLLLLSFSSNGKVKVEVKGTTSEVADSLRSIGLTAYHFVSGESEINRECYKFDGYNDSPICTVHWPVIKKLLDGYFTDLYFLKKYLSRGTQSKYQLIAFCKELIGRAKSSIKPREGYHESLISEYSVKKIEKKKDGFSLFEEFRNVFYSLVILLVFLVSQLLLIAGLVGFIWNVKDFFPVPLILVISILYVSFIIGIYYTSFWLKDVLVWQWIFLGKMFFSFLLVVAIFFVSGTCFYWVNIPKDYDSTYKNFVVVDRFTDQVVGRLTQDPSDNFYQFQSSFVNPIKYEVRTGLKLEGSFPYDFHLDDVRSDEKQFKLKSKINFRLIADNEIEYRRLVDRWPTTEVLQDSLMQYLTGLLSQVEDELLENLVLDDSDNSELEKTVIAKKTLIKVFEQDPLSKELVLSIE